MTDQETIRVPYGAGKWPVERLAEIRAGQAAGRPLAVVTPGAMLRINSGALDLPPPSPTEAAVPEAERVAAHLKRLYGGWNKAADRFIDRYFAFLGQQIDRHRAELDERLVPFDGLFRAEDFLYSAPLPLPHALLFAPAGPASSKTAAPADFVKVDFAWWLGARMVAVLLAPSPLTPGAARRQKERLAAAGIELADCSSADLSRLPKACPRESWDGLPGFGKKLCENKDSKRAFVGLPRNVCLSDAEFGWFARTLGSEGSRFWEGEALPAAPTPPGLPDF